MFQSQQTRGEIAGAGIGIRVAVYPQSGEPEITEVSAASPGSATVKFTRLIMEKVSESGGKVPEEAVREVVENLIHAEYRGVVVSVLNGGDSVRVSDKGPGIENKSRAMEFGFSGASPDVMRDIRGVGAGLGIARSAAEKAGGTVTVEDNIGGGTVATISAVDERRVSDATASSEKKAAPRKYLDGVPRMNITERQQKVLITVLECGEIGPSTVAGSLEISVSTAYRDLSVLEEHGLVAGEDSGKRVVTPLGRDLIEAIVGTWVK